MRSYFEVWSPAGRRFTGSFQMENDKARETFQVLIKHYLRQGMNVNTFTDANARRAPFEVNAGGKR